MTEQRTSTVSIKYLHESIQKQNQRNEWMLRTLGDFKRRITELSNDRDQAVAESARLGRLLSAAEKEKALLAKRERELAQEVAMLAAAIEMANREFTESNSVMMEAVAAVEAEFAPVRKAAPPAAQVKAAAEPKAPPRPQAQAQEPNPGEPKAQAPQAQQPKPQAPVAAQPQAKPAAPVQPAGPAAQTAKAPEAPEAKGLEPSLLGLPRADIPDDLPDDLAKTFGEIERMLEESLREVA